MRRRSVLAATAATLATPMLATTILGARAQATRAICYNCPPEWADWGGMLRLIGQRTGIAVPPDNKNSGQSLAALIAEKARPVADVVYLGGQVGPQAREAGVLAPFKPERFERIPAALRDPDGHWFTIHSGTLGLFANTQALGRRPMPESWADLLKPEYRGMVGYLDPTSAAVGQVGVLAVNLALGGTYENLDPGIAFFKRLAANQPIVPKQTAYARVLSGEIPILFDYDFNAYRAQFSDRAPTRFVIPREGTSVLPYVMGLVANGPNPEQGRRVLDFVLSDEGQKHWASAFLRPVFPELMPPDVAERFLPATEYARATPLDVVRMAAAARGIGERYAREVG
jgi:putative spermidine/putrescine transport system substrate-binding protein